MGETVTTLTDLINMLTGFLNTGIELATMLALFFVFWGLFQAFGSVENAEKRAEARQTIVWSLIALFIVVSLGGIIAVFSETFPDLRGGGGGTVTSGPRTSTAPTAVPGTSGQTNPIPASGAGSGPLKVNSATGRNTGPADFAP